MNDSPRVSARAQSSGIGFAGLLTIVFIVLKLTHVIDWSWWWVLAPLWVSFILGVLFFGLFILGAFLLSGSGTRRR